MWNKLRLWWIRRKFDKSKKKAQKKVLKLLDKNVTNYFTSLQSHL